MSDHVQWLREQAGGPMSLNPEHVDTCNRLAAIADELERLRGIVRLAEIANELERLRAIVDKLDKTRDGVPIVRGDRVYAVVNDDGDHWRGWLAVTGIEPAPGGRVLLIGDDGEGEAYADECYSSREAAEAAGGKREQ